MSTPRFVGIVTSATQYKSYVYGITEFGKVFMWDGKKWVELDNKGEQK